MMDVNEEEKTHGVNEMSSYFESIDKPLRPKKKIRYISFLVSFLAIFSMVMLIIWLYKGQERPQSTAYVESELLDELQQETPTTNNQEIQSTLLKSKRSYQQSSFLKSLRQKINQRKKKPTSDLNKATQKKEQDNRFTESQTDEINNSNNDEKPIKLNNLEKKPSIKESSIIEDNGYIKPINQKSDIEQLQDSVNELNKTTTYYYKIQLAAYGNKGQAKSLWIDLLERFPQWLDGLEPQYLLSNKGLYRLRAGHFNQKTGAESLCAQLEQQQQPCFVVSISLN